MLTKEVYDLVVQYHRDGIRPAADWQSSLQWKVFVRPCYCSLPQTNDSPVVGFGYTNLELKRISLSIIMICGLANGPLTMTFSAFLVVIDIHRACCSEFAVTVIMPAIYIDLASH